MSAVIAPTSLIFEQYAERLRRKRRSPDTVRIFANAVTRFDAWLHAQGLTAETASFGDVEDYFDQLPLAASTKSTHLKMVKAAYNYAMLRGSIRTNPALDVEVEEPEAVEPRIIPNEKLREIREGIIGTPEWVLFHLLIWTGMRRFEIGGLRWDDGRPEGSVVKLDEQTIRVKGKGNKMRVVPIHPALQEVLAELPQVPGTLVLNGKHAAAVSPATIQWWSQQLSPEYTPHDYRRTVATSLRRNGVDESVQNRIMGWGPKNMFQRHYDHVAPAELHRGILKLYADDPIY